MNTTDIIRPYLEACGYTPDRIKYNYVYSDSQGKECSIPLAAFAYESFDYRSSCIGVLDASNAPKGEYVDWINSYRDLGAPVIFSCFDDKIEWWKVKAEGAEQLCKDVFKNELEEFFTKRKDNFAPLSINRAKNLSRINKKHQLTFVDDGLMPVIEKDMGECLAKLMEKTVDILFADGFSGRASQKDNNIKWVVQSSFWLLCAKILHDKKVEHFKRINLQDVDQIIQRVNNHYGRQSSLEFTTNTKQQKFALQKAASIVFKHSSLANITTESFSYIYEKVFVTPNIRKSFGVHATPSYLVDYIVMPMWPWVQDIPQEKRVVFEPTCGHAPFLTSAMRLLRELYKGERNELHEYLKEHLIGLEKDSFAKEIARLSLTIADIPNPNGWDLVEKDAFEDELVSEISRKSYILLCNPPFENFNDKKNKYSFLSSCNKAAEILFRTLPYMPQESLFGVILPRVFLHGKPYTDLRKYILEYFALLEVTLLPENVFAYGKHKSVILVGKKTSRHENVITYNNIPKHLLERFRNSYYTETDKIPQMQFLNNIGYDLRIIPLQSIWTHCKNEYDNIQSIAIVGRGIEYKKVSDSISLMPVKGWIQGHVKFRKTCKTRYGKRKKLNLRLTDLPDLYWMDLSDKVIKNPRYGKEIGMPQILLNYARTSESGPWRLKALIDQVGRPATNAFIVIRPNAKGWDLNVLWAILTSPLANAFVYCHSMERHNLETTIRSIPIPNFSNENSKILGHLVKEYFDLSAKSDEPFSVDINKNEAKNLRLTIDAEIMKLYELPPKYEKKILDLFSGWTRNGVDFEFKGYYPENFESYVPLHEYISEEYQRSTAAFADEWVKKNRSDEINMILKTASEAYGEGEGVGDA